MTAVRNGSMTDISNLVARLDVDQKIAQIQGVLPWDLLDMATLMDPTIETPNIAQGYPIEFDRLAVARPHGVGHLSLGQQINADLEGLRDDIAHLQDVARELTPF